MAALTSPDLITDPEQIKLFVKGFNQTHSRKISPADEGFLLQDHDLATAVFRHGIGDLIAEGFISVTELNRKTELQHALENKYIAGAVKDHVIPIGQLKQMTPIALSEINELNARDPAYAEKIAKLLKVDKDKFRASMSKADTIHLDMDPFMFAPSPAPKRDPFIIDPDTNFKKPAPRII